MIYRARPEFTNKLLHLPESGMGFQIVEAQKSSSYTRSKYLVINSQLVIDIDEKFPRFQNEVRNLGFKSALFEANYIDLATPEFLGHDQIRNLGAVSEALNLYGSNQGGAATSPKENCDGITVFVRLSAYEDDKRIDFVNQCLLAGSYATTNDDYLRCKQQNDDPVERYALPNDEPIEWAFQIVPGQHDLCRRGTVQPAFGRRGGGEEALFDNGTSNGSYVRKTRY